MQKLSRYLAQHNLKPSAFAEKISVAPSTIHRLLKGERDCGFALAKKIEVGTNGEVKVAHIMAERIRRGAA